MTSNYRYGHFVWRELMTTDPSASIRFYSEVFGWKTETPPGPDGMEYTFAKVGDTGVAGIMKPPAPGIPSYWSGAVSVEDVDAVAKRVAAAGGQVLAPPMDVEGMGRYAGFTDPQGAVVNAWRGTRGDDPASTRPALGTFCWEQLNTTAPADALAFYGAVFGWTNRAFGGGGDMQVFEAGGAGIASVMQNPPGVPAHWLSYLVVETLPAAYERVQKQGGKVMIEKIDVPGVGAIGVIQDNVGAVIGVFEAPAG